MARVRYTCKDFSIIQIRGDVEFCFRATDRVPSLPATPDEVARLTATASSCTFLGRLKCVGLQMNVFKCI